MRDTATYIAPDGLEYQARKLDQDEVVDGAGTVGTKNEWVIFGYQGKRVSLCMDAAFQQQFQQRYPRAVDAEPQPILTGGNLVA